MATFVLVHGAYAGGWQMREVATQLRAASHEVFTPTLTGLGERSHLARPETDLATHVQDVVSLIHFEELREVILVGKSYGGMVVTGVAEQAPDPLRHLVYLDAVVPENGQCFLDIQGADVAGRMWSAVRERGDGWRLPADRTTAPRFTDQPFGTFTQPLPLTNPAGAAVPRTYILCTENPVGMVHTRITREAAARAKAAGWRYRELPTDHNAERVRPDLVAELLIELA